ncbi:MAG: membrane protein insertase YidC [Lysobacterales bacterium]
MNNQRLLLWMALFAVSYLLWQAWLIDYRPAPQTATADATPMPELPAATADAALPTAAGIALPAADDPLPDSTAPANGEVIEVQTDLMSLRIDSLGGSILSVDLKRYPVEAGQAQPVVRLLDDQPAHWFVAQSGLVAIDGLAPDHRARYRSASASYTLDAGQDTLEVPLAWDDGQGLAITKTLVFKRGEYVIGSRYQIHNQGSTPWTGQAYTQLQRVLPAAAGQGFSLSNPQPASFTGAAWYSPEDKLDKLAFKDFADEPLDRHITGGWAAMLQHYFFAAWIPDAGLKVRYQSAILDAGSAAPRYLLRQIEPALQVLPNAVATIENRLYVGPKLQEVLPTIAPGLGLAMDYGLVRLFAEPLFRYVLNPMHKLAGNWGVAIILTTVLIKLLLFPLASAQYRSMAKMRAVQPRMEAIKQRYGDDRQKLNQAMLELYQKEKINPAGGCLPIIPQMFMFIALYWVLIESVELRHAPFVGWLTNLSAHDPYFVLPVLNALTMWITQKMAPSPAGMDPIQQKMLQYMPLAFSVIMVFFPAGLVLYWTVNGSLGILQQWWITRGMELKKA